MDSTTKAQLQRIFKVVLDEVDINREFAQKIDNAINCKLDKTTELVAAMEQIIDKTTELVAAMEQITDSSKEQEGIIVYDGKNAKIHAGVKAAKVEEPMETVKRLGEPIEVGFAASTGKRRANRRDKAVLDPIHLAERGEAGLKVELSRLTEKQLKDIIAEYGMDQSKLAMKWKDKNRLIDLITETSVRRAKKGDVFRQ